jgi:membrane-associated phospholipid phosphatase
MASGTSPETPRQAIDALAGEARVGKVIVRRHAWRLLLGFLCIALPLWGFGELAEEVLEGVPLPFDEPVLQALHAAAGPPADIVLVVWLSLRRMYRRATFAAVALGGSALLNMAAKHAFHRSRPALWTSIAPEATFSFPSGHAMGSATLACVVCVLAWPTRARYPALVLGALFVAGVGLSRVYLGVHYPSDIVAGWSAGLAWTMTASRLIKERRSPSPVGRSVPVH